MVLISLHATPADQPPSLTPIRLLTEWTGESSMALGGHAAEKKPARYDQALAGQPAQAEMPAAGTGGQRGDDQ